jgi:polyisoprenyl-teichoic acid--peptidoglycan teichoic acid transferase
MHSAQDVRPRRRSSFVAAALSLIFPGLGHAYAGAWSRAVAFAALPLLLLAFAVGLALRVDKFTLAGIAVQTWFLSLVFVGNLVLLVYRLVAVVDAWRVARYLNASEGGDDGRGAARLALGPLSVAGLLAVILVMAGGHVAVARYDLLASSLADCVFDSSGNADCTGGTAGASGSPAESGSPGDSTASLPPEGSALPAASAPAWSGKPGERLNILLLGIDQRPGEAAFNTDTMIVVSIDPATKRVAMFSIPRDTVNVPVPPGPLRSVFGSAYGQKINSFYNTVRGRADLCPGPSSSRGYTCLKSVLGYLYGLNVQYYVQVNFDGFKKVVDALGGVTINVQSPVIDDTYPSDVGPDLRIYIPSGIQHMTGAQALTYARSRHGSTDFDRGARQQRVILSLRDQVDISAILPRVNELADAFKQTVRTDIPRDIVSQLLGLADQIDTKAVRSFVFAPPLYETEDYVPGVHDFLYPLVSKIRAAVKTAFTVDPNFEAQREKIAEELGIVWVLNGSGRPTEGNDVAGYLEYLGVNATAPNQKPPAALATTQIVVYNGAEARLPATIKTLQTLFKVTPVLKTDPSVHVDVIVTLGKATPDLTPPPIP